MFRRLLTNEANRKLLVKEDDTGFAGDPACSGARQGRSAPGAEAAHGMEKLHKVRIHLPESGEIEHRTSLKGATINGASWRRVGCRSREQ